YVSILLKEFQHLDTRRHSERISRKRTCLIHGPCRGDRFHNLPLSSVGAYRQPPSYDFSHGGEVRHHTIQFLCAARRKPESGHHFIEDEDDLVFIAELSEVLKVGRLWRDTTHISCHRF